ncbi:hypothetical protein ACPWR0_21820 [Pandoraea pneumonica]|uniref:hypothetical protein n=1 Tax=Pandoraea pneumonica TaxID=2508299 RepID=UPI003CFB5378
MTAFDFESQLGPTSRSLASQIDAALEAVREGEPQEVDADLPRPGEWDAAQCDAVYRCGYGAFERGDFLHAIECFAPLLSACPMAPDYAVALGLALCRAGEAEVALPIFIAAAMMDETAPGPMYRVGECLLRLSCWGPAIHALKETLVRCDDQPQHARVASTAQKHLTALGYPP